MQATPPPVVDRHALLHRLLAASLALWQTDAQLLPRDGQTPLLLHRPAHGEWLGVVAAAAQETPIRWWVVWYRDDPPGAQPVRRKPCASTLGLLRTLREALGVPAQGKARVGAGMATLIGAQAPAGARAATAGGTPAAAGESRQLP